MKVYSVAMTTVQGEEVHCWSSVHLSWEEARDAADAFMTGSVGNFLDIGPCEAGGHILRQRAVEKRVQRKFSISYGNMVLERTWKADDMGGLLVATCVREDEL